MLSLGRIGDLAGQVMRVVEALVKKSDTQITDSASVLQKIVAAAADEKGEWQLPLSDDRVLAMRGVSLLSLYASGLLNPIKLSSFW